MREIIGTVLDAFRPLRPLALIFAVTTVGCHAQTTAKTSAPDLSQPGPPQTVQAGVKLSPELARRVEVMIRSRSQVPPEYLISISEPTGSEIPGYFQIVVTFTAKGNSSKPLPFLLSTDGRTLAQFNKFDLSHAPRDKVSAFGRPGRGGPENAPVLIVGFDDLECPFCAKMNAQLFPAILDRYGNLVRVVYRDFPLEDLHPWAMHAAVDANCLGATTTEGYWNFVDYVHAHAAEIGGTEKTAAKAMQQLDQITLDEGARQKINQPALVACVLKQDETGVRASIKVAEDVIGGESTPVLFVNGEKVEGVTPMEDIYRIVDEALMAAGQTPPSVPSAAPITTKSGN